jgi:hypothetical protein
MIMTDFLYKLRGSLYSKTSNAAIIVVVIGVLEQLAPGLLANVVPADYSGLLISALGVLFWLLRWVTSKPLDLK